MRDSSPLFSVIIPTCGDVLLLRRCLERLTLDLQGVSESEFEVIVSNDGDEVLVEELRREFLGVTFVQGPRRGPAANRNRAAQAAHGKWLVFADDDCVPDERWLWAYKVAINTHPSYRVLEGRIYTESRDIRLDEFAPTNEVGGFLWSCNFAIENKLFIELGGFEEQFLYPAMEDVELRYRLKLRSEDFLFIRAAAVFHPLRMRRGREELRRREEATLTYLKLHPEERISLNSWHYIKCALRGLLRTTLPAIISGRTEGLKFILLEHVSNVRLAWILLR